MRIAAIDIGTNSVLLLIMEDDRVVCDISEITRLGEGLRERGYILPEPARRTLEVISRWHKMYLGAVGETIIFGTHVLREAENASHFVESMKRSLDLEVRILSPHEEAFYSYLSVIRDREMDLQEFVLLDIGGGSTEVVEGNKDRLEGMTSLQVGCVTLRELFINHDPPEEEEVLSLESYLKRKIEEGLVGFERKSGLVCVGGTATTACSVLLGLERFDRRLVHGKKIVLSDIEALIGQLRKLKLERIRAMRGMDGKRAEVFLSGLILLRELLSFFSQREAVVSTHGARYGIIYERLGR
jgi:exopolyphosphatase/guanosine-5'-triphosphate,3'-diphosphate pyrophosphatase